MGRLFDRLVLEPATSLPAVSPAATVSLSADARVVGEEDAALFLEALTANLQSPARLLI